MPTDSYTFLDSLIVRPCCGMSVNGYPHLTCLAARHMIASLLLRVSRESCVSLRLNLCSIARLIGGICDPLHTYIGQTKLCHFSSSKLSRYCFLSCNCCSLWFKRGHLFNFKLCLILLHLSSNIRSIAANIFMVIS